MPDDAQPSEEGAGYAAEDAALAQLANQAKCRKVRWRNARGQRRTSWTLATERFGPRKPMGPTAGMVPETVPEELTEAEETPAEEKPRSGKRKGAK